MLQSADGAFLKTMFLEKNTKKKLTWIYKAQKTVIWIYGVYNALKTKLWKVLVEPIHNTFGISSFVVVVVVVVVVEVHVVQYCKLSSE